MCLFWKAKANSTLDQRFADYRMITAEELKKEKKKLGKGLDEMNIDGIRFIVKGKRPPLDIYSKTKRSIRTYRAKIGNNSLPRFTDREFDQILIVDGSLTLVKADPEKEKHIQFTLGRGSGHVTLK